jgi:peptide/nickel transport system permease protein
MPNVFLILIPFMTTQMSILLGGTVIVESILLLPGMGTLLLNAVQNRDYSLLQGVLTVMLALIAFLNILGDVLLALMNPSLSPNRSP